MYTTFAGPVRAPSDDDKATPAEAPNPNSSKSFEAPLRPKRQQVARACDSCRMHRIKCDNSVPCRNCIHRGEQCNNKSPSERRTLPQAYREIDRLKQKVKELEAQLEKGQSLANAGLAQQTPPASMPTPTSSPPSSMTATHITVPLPLDPAKPQRIWDGIFTSTAQSAGKTWYGPSSAFFFIHRMNAYLTSVFQTLHPDDHIQLKSVAKMFPTPDCQLPSEEQKIDDKEPALSSTSSDYLTPSQEEYFLNLYWQSYHTSQVVLDESEFKEHFKSLLTTPGKPRKPCPLIDIVIALSMQVGVALARRNTLSRAASAKADVGKDDPSIAGRHYYRRCQRLLNSEQETPTIMTVQCHFLSGVYLCCAAFQNMCHTSHALAIRTAHMLGLHREPRSELPPATRELHKRLWWTIYGYESKTCMKLGRAFYADLSSTSCSLPLDDHTVARLAGSNFAPIDEETTFLSYTLHNTRLILAARVVHMAFFDHYSDYYTGETGRNIYDEPASLEAYAGYLQSVFRPLEDWILTVPDALKNKRAHGGVPLSTDRSPLILEEYAPQWLQRQRLLLELLYHNLRMNLYRVFITFPSATPVPSPPNPMVQAHSLSAAEHAMALTYIMHQSLSENDLLAGWHEAFQWLWNAALTLAGYLFAYPNSSVAGHVREAVDRSITTFEIIGRSFGAANSAALVMADLAAKYDFLASLSPSPAGNEIPAPPTTLPSAPAAPTEPLVATAPPPTAQYADYGAPFTAPPPLHNDPTSMQNLLAGPMEAFAVDTSGDSEMLWPTIGNMPGQWWYDFSQAPALGPGVIDESFA
ncbi:hypothetical protein F4780DRAFT_774157 [Xylariomycetidae sp. FL0641]|nr:hypothetical protein F4780DRAFT_774157 [Xylariomycetidae sp. FL0641]